MELSRRLIRAEKTSAAQLMFDVEVLLENRWIGCPNASKSIGNGFRITKYVGAMVRKFIRLPIATEDHLSEVIIGYGGVVSRSDTVAP